MQHCVSCQSLVRAPSGVCETCGWRPSDTSCPDGSAAASGTDHSELIAFAKHANIAVEKLTRHAFRQLNSIDALRGDLRSIAETINDQGSRLDAVEQSLGALHRQRLSDAEIAEAKLSKIERDLQDFGRHAAGDRLRRLAHALRNLWSDLLATLPGSDDQALIAQQLEGFAADVGLSVVLPVIGEAFDSRTMTPVAGSRGPASGSAKGAAVEALIAPGFLHDGEVIECARVRLCRATSPRSALTISSHDGNGAAIRQEQLQ